MSQQAAVYWRFVLCDLMGRAISILSPVAREKQLNWPLNRPARVSFTVPSDHRIVNEIYDGDGWNDPALTAGTRVIKAFRKVDGAAWHLHGNFLVWDLEDQGDGTTTQTAVTGYDIFQFLRKRLIYNADGTVHRTVNFNGGTTADADPGWAPDGNVTGMYGDQIARMMVQRSIDTSGFFGVTLASGAGASFTQAPRQNKHFDQQFISPGLIEMCDTGLLDVWFQPLDRTDGTLWAMHAAPRRESDTPDGEGLTKPNVIISYAAPGRTAYQIDRTVSMETMCNDLRLWGTSSTGPEAHINEDGGVDGGGNVFTVDPAIIADIGSSITKFYRYEDAAVEASPLAATAVQALATEEIVLRLAPRTLLSILPTPGLAPPPFSSDGGYNYFLGDTVRVLAGIGGDQASGSWVREGINGVQRIYGISLDVTDDGVERVAGLDVSPQGV